MKTQDPGPASWSYIFSGDPAASSPIRMHGLEIGRKLVKLSETSKFKVKSHWRSHADSGRLPAGSVLYWTDLCPATRMNRVYTLEKSLTLPWIVWTRVSQHLQAAGYGVGTNGLEVGDRANVYTR
jgi:hypothetical protein